MTSLLKKFFLGLILGICLFGSVGRELAIADNQSTLDELNQKIAEYEKKISELQGEQKTLSSTISYLDNKVQLTQVQIAVTEQELKILTEEIAKLSIKIGDLEKSLTEVSAILNLRISETYKKSFVKPVYFLFAGQGLNDILSRVKYLKAIQLHDREMLIEMQKSKINFDSQKDLKEEKQAKEEELKKQLVSQQIALAQQKKSKQDLLTVTKNDEKKFQSLLAEARAEMEAIQSVIAGQGEETKVGEVNEGDKVASIISGSSACSTGAHLHFQVTVNNNTSDPASYLNSRGVTWSLCGWYGCDQPFSFTGSWNWPMNDPITVTQGYGMTAYARSGAYSGGPHTGLDLVSDNLSVKAVKNGTLYRGSIACGGGTLRYVKISHKDSDIVTYYMHVNYY